MNATTIETKAPETTTSTVDIRIDDGPVTPDADGRNRGWSAALWLDPEDRDVTVWRGIGNGVPAHVWHNRSMHVAIHAGASGESVRAICEAHRATIAAIFDSYEGAEWDGSNHVGSWETDDDGEPLYVPLVAKLEAALAEAKTYWPAGDWLSGAWEEGKHEVAEAIDGLDGDAREAALDEVAEAWVAQGKSDGVTVDLADVRRQIDRMVEQLAKTAEDDGDDE